MIGSTRTFIVAGGSLVFPASLTINPPVEAVDQHGNSWFKGGFDLKWRAMSEDDKPERTVECEFRRG